MSYLTATMGPPEQEVDHGAEEGVAAPTIPGEQHDGSWPLWRELAAPTSGCLTTTMMLKHPFSYQ